MALWLVAVIVLIAVGAMPSAAQAHSGGHDGMRSGHVHAEASRVVAKVDLSKPDFLNHSLRIQARAEFGTVCDGTCCQPGCRTGASCCTGAGLAPESETLGHAPRARGQAPAWAASARTDIVPEALPEPPRSLA